MDPSTKRPVEPTMHTMILRRGTPPEGWQPSEATAQHDGFSSAVSNGPCMHALISSDISALVNDKQAWAALAHS